MLVARATRSSIVESTPIAGYIVARETAGELHINNVAVRAEYRRRGIGAALLERVIQEARLRKANTAFLEVRSANLAAQALYEKSGFRAIARRANYYSEPREDAVVMSLVLG
jgi:ribosomal-protein-alanine N-acetyltransferase